MPGIKQQRQDRVSSIISILEANGFIKSIKTSADSTFYQITNNGIDAYSKWVKEFLDFARSADMQKNNSDK